MTVIVRQASPIPRTEPKASTFKFPTGFCNSDLLTLQEVAGGSSLVADTTTFFTSAFNRDQANTYNWVSKYGICTDSSPVTLIDLTDSSGTLTNIITPTGESGTEVTVVITIDGVEYLFNHTLSDLAYKRRIFGGTYSGVASTTDSTTTTHPSIGGVQDGGWQTSKYLGLYSPLQNRGESIGIPFSSSLKVTIQSTESVATEARNYGGMAYVRG